MKKLLLLLCVLFVLILCACQITVTTNIPKEVSPSPVSTKTPKATEEPQNSNLLGKVEGNTYTNEALGFSATIPDGWEVADEEELSTVFGVSLDYMEEKTGLKSDSTMYIFFCSENGVYSSGQNPNINIGVSNQAIMFSILESESGLNYFLENYRPIIEKMYGNSDFELTGEAGVKVGANEYVVIHLNAEYQGTHTMQDQYIFRVKDYAIIITLTYFNNDDKAAVDSFVESLKSE